jgi:bifunctional UDP-N-acetylglucosamine pyrophosphorylase/glucosamine-1-phosphate N-acetyltransferase
MEAAELAVVILAAGHGTRMKSTRPKVLHEAAGRPLLEHVLRAVKPLSPAHALVVVGHDADQVRSRFSGWDVGFVVQEEQLGTGHALLSALPELEDFPGDVMVLTGDAPLVTAETLSALRDGHRAAANGMTLLTYRVADPRGLGRIVRDPAGNLLRIVEEKDASAAERELDEINPGLVIFDRNVHLLARQLRNDNAQGEYYLTDLPGIFLEAGLRVGTVEGRDETGLLVGVNDRSQLAQAERILRDRVRRRWLSRGVTMIAPELTFIDDSAELARDVLLEPGVILRGAVRLGEGVRVGAYSVLEDVTIGPGESVPAHTLRSSAAAVNR